MILMNKVQRFSAKKKEMEDIEKFKQKIVKSLAEIFFLHVVNEKAQYGYGIRKTVEERFGIKIPRVTCYLKLYGLEKMGYVKSKKEDILSRPMRIRRYYSITDKGKKLLNIVLDYLDTLELIHITEKKREKKEGEKIRKEFVHPTS